jgi:hypothetical protein
MHTIPAHRNPVARAVAKHAMEQAARTERIATLLMQQDEEATETLAHLAWIVGVGCETALQVHGPQSPLTKRLHGALRTVQAMCLQHAYRWQAQHAVPLQAALAEAHEVITAHPAQAGRFTRGADQLAHAITHHQLQAGDVAGAEIYATAPQLEEGAPCP